MRLGYIKSKIVLESCSLIIFSKTLLIAASITGHSSRGIISSPIEVCPYSTAIPFAKIEIGY